VSLAFSLPAILAVCVVIAHSYNLVPVIHGIDGTWNLQPSYFLRLCVYCLYLVFIQITKNKCFVYYSICTACRSLATNKVYCHIRSVAG